MLRRFTRSATTARCGSALLPEHRARAGPCFPRRIGSESDTTGTVVDDDAPPASIGRAHAGSFATPTSIVTSWTSCDERYGTQHRRRRRLRRHPEPSGAAQRHQSRPARRPEHGARAGGCRRAHRRRRPHRRRKRVLRRRRPRGAAVDARRGRSVDRRVRRCHPASHTPHHVRRNPGGRGGAGLGGRRRVLVAGQLRLLGVVERRVRVLPGAEDRTLSERRGHLPAAPSGGTGACAGNALHLAQMRRGRAARVRTGERGGPGGPGCSTRRSRGRRRWPHCPRRRGAP